MTRKGWGRPAAGKEPAAAALLGWLADPAAPRLCLVTGAAGRGKSLLLAWLVGHGTQQGAVAERAVHAFVPLGGQSVHTTVWTLADQLWVSARTPGELVEALQADQRRTVIVLADLHASADPEEHAALVLALLRLEHVRLVTEARTGALADRLPSEGHAAVLNVDEARWTDAARYEAWLAQRRAAGRNASEQVVTPRPGKRPDLDDPVAVCAADPWEVTTAYAVDTDEHGGLRTAWLRAGQSLCRDQEPAERALVLLTALGDGADPRFAPALTDMASSTPWMVGWSRVREDVLPPWPGPVLSSAKAVGQLILADHAGVLRAVDAGSGAPTGRLADPVPQVVSLAPLADGTLLALDSRGRLCTQQMPAVREGRGSGLQALLEELTPTKRLVQSLAALLLSTRGTSLASTGETTAVGDADGSLHLLTPGSDSATRTARLHQGPVNALAIAAPSRGSDGASAAIVYSGGADGTVRAWAPAAAPLAVPVATRSCPVVSVDAAYTETGLVLVMGWGDGLVEHRRLDVEEVRLFRPGPPVNAVTVTSRDEVLIGTHESLTCLLPR